MLYGYWASLPIADEIPVPVPLPLPVPISIPAPPPEDPPRPPPLYEAYHERERNLPQHNMSLPYPEGAHAKFLWAANHGSGTRFGWGNYMQEMVLNAYLAYAAQRAYVFDNYTWDRGGEDITSWGGKAIPARIPLSAFISGPIIGGPTGNKDIPRAVSREYFLSVCPESQRVTIDTQTIQDTLGPEPTVSQIVERWVTELKAIESPCVELSPWSPPLFSYIITNTIRVLDVFPALSKSPILADFGWSPLTLEGFYHNRQFFADPWAMPRPAPPLKYTSPLMLRGLLALHVRRGDYETWCDDAFRNAMDFTGFNSFPALPDRYTPPDRDIEKNVNVTRAHCLPSIPQIVKKVRAVTAHAPHMTRIYVMSNAPAPWLADLTHALRAAHPWPRGISTSRDLELSWEGKFVSQAVDLHVGQRAEKLIGNGFSSLTSNMVMLRMANPALSPSDTQFW
ncbi:hypothetical protein B0H17DRAFT_924778 [Mycena rosella]|uniref:Uncharacterized protein n=1 Tax=Mycena rosella TaxID=1033263 RepID=A0AAD7DW71_MYCRO|nr:hypothetical protein B0H17DRAFT_924778 [Mycena rosella]